MFYVYMISPRLAPPGVDVQAQRAHHVAHGLHGGVQVIVRLLSRTSDLWSSEVDEIRWISGGDRWKSDENSGFLMVFKVIYWLGRLPGDVVHLGVQLGVHLVLPRPDDARRPFFLAPGQASSMAKKARNRPEMLGVCPSLPSYIHLRPLKVLLRCRFMARAQVDDVLRQVLLLLLHLLQSVGPFSTADSTPTWDPVDVDLHALVYVIIPKSMTSNTRTCIVQLTHTTSYNAWHIYYICNLVYLVQSL